jgi:hypothetical protein
MGYIIRDIKTKKLVRASTTCQRDINRRGSKIKVLRAFSGDEPFFTVKIGSLHTEIQVLKFMCGAKHKKCRDESGTYEWTGISLFDARTQQLEFSEPGYVDKDEAEAPVAKVKVEKVAKVKKVKAEKVAKVKAAKVAKVKPVKVAKVKPVKEAPAEEVGKIVSVEEEIETPTKPVQTDEEFEADIDAAFQEDLKKAARASNA